MQKLFEKEKERFRYMVWSSTSSIKLASFFLLKAMPFDVKVKFIEKLASECKSNNNFYRKKVGSMVRGRLPAAVNLYFLLSFSLIHNPIILLLEGAKKEVSKKFEKFVPPKNSLKYNNHISRSENQ